MCPRTTLVQGSGRQMHAHEVVERAERMHTQHVLRCPQPTFFAKALSH